jgi:hypothetical protein
MHRVVKHSDEPTGFYRGCAAAWRATGFVRLPGKLKHTLPMTLLLTLPLVAQSPDAGIQGKRYLPWRRMRLT